MFDYEHKNIWTKRVQYTGITFVRLDRMDAEEQPNDRLTVVQQPNSRGVDSERIHGEQYNYRLQPCIP